MKIPSNRLWTQDSSGDVLGILGDTTNVSLDTAGKVTLSKKAVAIKTTVGDSNFNRPIVMTYFATAVNANNRKYTAMTLNTGGIFQGGLDGNGFSRNVAFDPSTFIGSDALIFNSLLHVTTSTNLSTWNGSNTVDHARAALTGSLAHPMCIFESQITYQLAIGNGNTVRLYDTAYNVGTNILTLPAHMMVTTMRYRNGYLYVGTRNDIGGEAYIYIWDGTANYANYACAVGCSWVFSMTEFKNTVAAVVSSGQIGYVSGSTFMPLAAFPVYYDPHARWQGSTGLLLNGKIFNRGMITIGDNIYMNVDGDVDIGFIPKMKSGLWVYNPRTGLSHKSKGSVDAMVTDATFTVSDSTITTTAVHNLKTGDAVYFASVAGLTGITVDKTYYVTVLSTTTFKLSQGRKAASEQKYVLVAGTPTTSSLRYFPNTDYGDGYCNSGPIIATVYNETPLPPFKSEVIWSSNQSLQTGTTNYVINSFYDSYNIGSMTTQRINGENVDQSWKEIYAFIDGLTLTSEELVVKVQTKYEPPTQKITGIWLSSTTINSTPSSDFTLWADIKEGDEIVFVDGYNRGKTVHVTEVSQSTSTVSLTVDEAIGIAATNSTLFRTTFKKANTFTSTDKIKERVRATIDSLSSPWIAIKLELRGFTPSVNVLELSNVIQSNTN